MHAQSLISFEALTDASIHSLLTRSVHWSNVPHRLPASHQLQNACAAFLFFEPSSRTRISFERAAQRLQMDVSHFPIAESSLKKGESLIDTFLNLETMGIDVFVVRLTETPLLLEIGNRLSTPILCAGAGKEHHPTQALLDAATLMKHGYLKKNSRILYWGDTRNSRVAASGIELFQRLGASVACAGPEEFSVSNPQVPVFHTPDEALSWADIVIALRLQKERLASTDTRLQEEWILKEAHLKQHPNIQAWMHPGPVIWDEDIESSLKQHPKNLILEQARMGVATRMAAFEWSLGELP